MADVSNPYTFFRTSNITWATVTSKRAGGFTATITEGAKPDPYTLLIQPGSISSDHPTRRAAMNQFRKFLFDKPVNT